MSTPRAPFGHGRTRKTDSSRRALTLGLAMSTLGAATLTLTVPSLASATPPDCIDVLAVMTPGTWETTSDADPSVPVGMLAPVGNALKSTYGDTVELFYTPYAASAFDQGKTYGDSKTTAIDAINVKVSTVAAKCPRTTFIFAGYSQGADATGDIASAIGNGKGPISADKVLAVGLLADPGQGTASESVVGPHATGTGIADPRPHGMGTLTRRVATICDPQDLYCSIDKGSNSVLGALGTVLSKSPGASTDSPIVGGGSRLATALTSDFSHADLSGIGALHLPGWAEDFLHEPGAEISRMTDWTAKLDAIVERTWNRNVSLVAGMPNWVLALAAQLAVLEIVLLVAAVVLYQAEVAASGAVLLVTTFVAATTGLAFVGTLYGGLAAGAKGRETLLPLLMLPVVARLTNDDLHEALRVLIQTKFKK